MLRGGSSDGPSIDADAAIFMTKAKLAPTKAFFKLADKGKTGRVTVEGARDAAEEIFRRKKEVISKTSLVRTKIVYTHPNAGVTVRLHSARGGQRDCGEGGLRRP